MKSEDTRGRHAACSKVQFKSGTATADETRRRSRRDRSIHGTPAAAADTSDKYQQGKPIIGPQGKIAGLVAGLKSSVLSKSDGCRLDTTLHSRDTGKNANRNSPATDSIEAELAPGNWTTSESCHE